MAGRRDRPEKIVLKLLESGSAWPRRAMSDLTLEKLILTEPAPRKCVRGEQPCDAYLALAIKLQWCRTSLSFDRLSIKC